MIVLDIESSGIHTGKCGIWQIGAFEFENLENKFLQESKIDDEDLVHEGALKVTGKTEKELRDENKQTQKELISNYLSWAKKCKNKLIIGHNIGWDLNFIQNKCLDYGLMKEFREAGGQRGIDTHVIAQKKYFEIHGEYLLQENGKSNMNLSNVLKFCGIPDLRIKVEETGERDIIKKQGSSHNALEDCKLTAEAFSRLVYRKNLFPEYSKFEIPRVLKK